MNQGSSVSVDLCTLVHNEFLMALAENFPDIRGMCYVDDTILSLTTKCGKSQDFIRDTFRTLASCYGLKFKFLKITDLALNEYVLLEIPSVAFEVRTMRSEISDEDRVSFARAVTMHFRCKEPTRRLPYPYILSIARIFKSKRLFPTNKIV